MQPSLDPHQRARMIEALEGARFRLSRRNGYDCADVDNWIDLLSEQARTGQIDPTDLADVRFRMNRRDGYDVSDVDSFVDDLVFLLTGQRSAPTEPAEPPLDSFMAKVGRVFMRR